MEKLTEKKQAPLLSIVIPTKNRYETLLPTLAALLENIQGRCYEIVVQDNSDDPHRALEFVAAKSDPRIEYIHCQKRMSIVENTELALERARGRFVTFIGDDDFVVPDILSYVRDFDSRGIDAVIYPPCYYWWPSVIFSAPSAYHRPGAFWYPRSVSKSERRVDTKAELKRVADAGAVALFDLPRVYHGLIRTDVLKALKTRAGAYVNGASPDMALAVGVASELSSHIKIEIPLSVYGASKNSGGGWTASGTHYGQISDQAHLPRSTIDGWSQYLPPIWSEHTIYLQTVIEVFRALRQPSEIKYESFYASMLVNEPHLKSFTYPFAIKYLLNNPTSFPRFCCVVLKKTLGNIRRRLNSSILSPPWNLFIFDNPGACLKYLGSTGAPNSSV